MAQKPTLLVTSQDHEVGGVGLRVLLALRDRLDRDEKASLDQSELARGLSLRVQHVHRAIKKLVGLGIILEGPRIGIHRSFQLNPDSSLKDPAKERLVLRRVK